jgi:hypothetical protein
MSTVRGSGLQVEASRHRGAGSTPDIGVLDWLLTELAARVVDELAERQARGAVSRYATASNNPIGSPRAFLDAGRAGKFRTFKRGRQVCALWADVEHWIESRKRPVRENSRADPADDDRAQLERAGVQLRGRPPPANARGRAR